MKCPFQEEEAWITLPLIGLPVWQIPLIPTISSNTPQLRIKYNNWKGNLKFAQEKKKRKIIV